jgi:hypothetical protein
MASAPPQGPQDERGSTGNDTRSATDDAVRPPLEVTAGVEISGPGDLPPVGSSAHAEVLEEIALYEEEASLEPLGDPKRTARLLYEAAHLREEQLGNAREARKTYTQSLTTDPTLQATTWALFGLFDSRSAWENLVRLLDAEIRFAPLPTPADRADILVEKGRILEGRLGRPDQARAAYRAALELSPTHPAALLALVLSALPADTQHERGAERDVERALAGLAAHVAEPQIRALFAVELAAAERGSLAPETANPEAIEKVRRSIENLLQLSLSPSAEEPVAAELHRLSLVADDPNLRSRVLDFLDSRVNRADAPFRLEPAFLVAVYREKARLLHRRGAPEAALVVLERGLRIAPHHPLLIADLLDIAEKTGLAGTIAPLLEEIDTLSGGVRRDEALLRRAEAAAREGALGEAMRSLDRLSPRSRLHPLCALARVRVVARSGDADGLARLFAAEAERLLAPTNGASAPAVADEEAAREAAHLLVRAAYIQHQVLGNAREAREPALRALAVVPDYAPAREVLRAVLAELREWAALAQLLEADAAAAITESRKLELHKVLLVLYRDVLRDPSAARRFEPPGAAPGDEMTLATRAADQAGDRYVATGEGAEEAIRQLRSLSEHAERADGRAAATLRLLASRLAGEAGAERSALALAEEAFRCAPGSPEAAAELERHYRLASRSDDRLEVLARELEASEKNCRSADQRRALRFRLAFAAADAGKIGDALAWLRPLREQKDRSAVLWSWEIAHGSGLFALETDLLGEPAVAAVFAEKGGRGAAQRLLALGEAHEDKGDQTSAAESYQAGLEVAPPGPLALEAALGLLRVSGGQKGKSPAGDSEMEEKLVRGFERLSQAALTTPIATELLRESDLLSLALGKAGAGAASSADGPLDAIRLWVRGIRNDDTRSRLDGLERMARAKVPPVAAAELWATLGLRRLLSGDRVTAWGALAKAAEGPTAPLVELCASDLGADMPLPGRIAHARRARAERLGQHPGAGAALAEALLVEEGWQEERLGRWHAAASNYAQALEHEPESLEALEGLRRVSLATENRRGQAAAHLRIAARLENAGRAAERYTQAGGLYEEEGLEEEAANAYLEVLRRIPENEEAYKRLRRILVRREQPARLEKLISFKIAHTPDPGAKVLLYTERAALRLGPLGKRNQAIHDHRRILALDPDRVSSLRLLARLAMSEERFTLAVDFLNRALTRPGIAVEDGGAIALELAGAYEANERPEDAERVLRMAIEGQPEDPVVRERLVALALRTRRFELAAEQLRVLQALTEERSAKAAVAVRLARLERVERKNPAAALVVLRAALQLDPLGEVVGEMIASVGEGPLSPEDAGAINGVIADLRRTLEQEPLAVRPLECLRDLAALRGLTDLHAAAAQLLTALGMGSTRGRSRDLQRPVALHSLGAPGNSADAGAVSLMREVWPHLSSGVARLYGPAATDLGIGKQTRLAPGSEPRLAWAESASLAIGIPSLSIFVPPLDDLWIAALDSPEPSLALGRGVVGGDPVSRFRVGRSLALLRECATMLDRIAPDELNLIWNAALYLADPSSFDRVRPPYDQETLRVASRKLGKVLSRRELKNVEGYALALEQITLDVPAWRNAVLRTANRFGLLVSGDLAAALRALSQRSAPSRQDLLGAACQDLIQFAFSDRFATVRREAGLSKD